MSSFPGMRKLRITANDTKSLATKYSQAHFIYGNTEWFTAYDLMAKYENPIEHACDIEEGQVFIANGWQKPDGLCESAWQSMSPFVMGLAHGAEDFYEGWMKNPRSVMISCNDGFRPVSFLLETMDEEHVE